MLVGMRQVLGVLLLLLPASAMSQRVETGFVDRMVTVNGTPFHYQVYVPADYAASGARWPVILFLHGAGERGANGLVQTNVGIASAIRSSPARYPALVVMPQVPTDSLWLGTPAQAAIAALDATMAEYRTDPDRVYLTGLSMGGNGTWNLAYQFPQRFAAVAAICSFVTPMPMLRGSHAIVPGDGDAAFATLARRLASVPVWIFHGEVDPVVPVTESRRAAEALKAAGGNVRYTEIMGGGHNVWDLVYGSPQFTEWLFAQRRPSR